MRIVDVSAFYAPAGGGVRTYVEAKLRAAPRLRPRDDRDRPRRARRSGRARRRARSWRASRRPKLPVDRRYRYFDDERALHAMLDAWRPDHVEASSPWSSATMVGRWQGVGNAIAGHACRSARGLRLSLARRHCVDRDHRPLVRLVLAASARPRPDVRHGRLRQRAAHRAASRRRHRERGNGAGWASSRGSSRRRCDRPSCAQRRWRRSGSTPNAILLIGVGRFSAEKRWDMVMRAVGERRAAGAGRLAPRRRRRSAAQARAARGPLRQRRGDAASRRPRRARAPARQRRRAGPRLRGGDILHGRGRGAGERHSADRSRSRRGGRSAACAGAGATYRVGQRGLARAGDRRLHRSRPRAAARRRGRAPARCARWTSISPNCSRATKRCRGHCTPTRRSQRERSRARVATRRRSSRARAFGG